MLDAVRDDAGFDRGDVVDWLVLRARLASAHGDEALVDRELARIATLVDDVALPPDLRARFDALASTVAPLDVALRWGDGALEASTDVEDAVLVRALRVSALERGERRVGTERLAILEPAECRAEVIGPGGAVLASATGCPASARATPDGAPEPPPASGGDEVWIAIGITIGVLVVGGAATAIGLTVGAGPQDVSVGSVVVRW